MRPPAALVVAALLSAAAVAAQPVDDKRPASEVADLVNALLGGLLGGGEVDGARLQEEVAQAGGVEFRRDVPVAFLGKEDLAAYLREVFDEDYPSARARADERLLQAFDLLSPGTDLRALRARVLEENVVGFYDERPGKRRLYAVSEEHTFSPMNQIVLAHELRHALQDQYEELDSFLAEDVSDYDDRSMAWICLLEGDATLVMERFVRLRLGGLGGPLAGADEDAGGALGPGLLDVPGAPPVVRDQLVQPYLAGLDFARALWSRGGAGALRDAWKEPPESTEQVLHPDKFFARERPRIVAPSLPAPPGSQLVSEGVLGELLIRTLVEEGASEAAAGWGGDAWRLWDVGGRTVLAWRSEWDGAGDAAEFHAALRTRFARRGTPAGHAGWELFAGEGGRRFAIRRSGEAVELASADDEPLLRSLIGG